MVDTIRETQANKNEIVAYVDEDDATFPDYPVDSDIAYVSGPRIMLTACWNRCIPAAKGDIFLQGNDDVVFKTPGWDVIVEEAFSLSNNKIKLVHGSDEGQHFENFAAHGFVHKRWVDTIGYFIPPYFCSDFGDTWLNDVANQLGVRQYVPIIIEHLHFLFGKAPLDDTYNQRLKNHAEQRPDALYWSDVMVQRRRDDVAKLKALIDAEPDTPQADVVPRWVDPKC